MPESLEPTDAEAWARAVSGDPTAFGLLFDRHANEIYSFCLRRTGDRGIAEDLMSATFLHGWRRRQEVEPHLDGPLPLLYGIAANLVRVHLRSAGCRRAAMARIPIASAEPDPADDVVTRLDDARRMDRVLRALGSLPDGDQELFVLCAWQELSYEQVAVALDIPIGTVRSRLSRARARLRSELAEPTVIGGDELDETTEPTSGRRAEFHG